MTNPFPQPGIRPVDIDAEAERLAAERKRATEAGGFDRLPHGTAMILRIAGFDLVPFIIGACERAGMAWSIERHQGLAATVLMRHEGDPAKIAAADAICHALVGAAKSMNDTGPDGEPTP